MKPENYIVVKVMVGGLAFASFLELPCCKLCGNFVGDTEIHDRDHERQNSVAMAASRGDYAASWMTPIR